MTKIGRLAWVALFASGAASLASQAAAQDPQGLQTPSHNIFCQVQEGDSGEPTTLRCDLQSQTAHSFARLRDCREDSGDSFAVAQRGAKGFLVCHGDTTRLDSLPVIAYGRSWRAAGFSCQSALIGLTCQNAAGHGFFVSKASQRLF